MPRSARCSKTSFFNRPTAALRSAFDLSGSANKTPSLVFKNSRVLSWISATSFIFAASSSFFGFIGSTFDFPKSARTRLIKSMTGARFAEANFMASSTVASGTRLAPASTMMVFSGVPATTRSRSPSATSRYVGIKMNLPSFMPMRTAAIGPLHGMSEIASAHDAPIKPGMSASFSWSCENTVATTAISFLKPSGNNGRTARSIKRPLRMASSVGRPSRLIKREPLMRPAAYIRSSKSTANGKKSTPSRASPMVAVHNATVSPN